MKVGSSDYPKTVILKEEDMTTEQIVTSFKCPKCQGNANLVGVEVYICFDCGIVWSVE